MCRSDYIGPWKVDWETARPLSQPRKKGTLLCFVQIYEPTWFIDPHKAQREDVNETDGLVPARAETSAHAASGRRGSQKFRFTTLPPKPPPRPSPSTIAIPLNNHIGECRCIRYGRKVEGSRVAVYCTRAVTWQSWCDPLYAEKGLLVSHQRSNIPDPNGRGHKLTAR
jgi:hypothetical protein